MQTIFKQLLLKRRIVVPIIVLLAVLGGVYLFRTAPVATPESPMQVEIETIREKLLRKIVRLSAVVNPKRMTLFQAQEKGAMGPLLVESGSFVKEGTLLAEMRNGKWRRAVEYAQEKASLEKDHYLRQKKLAAGNNKSQRSLDQAQETWLSAEIAFEEAKKALARTQFKAPYDGQVGIFKAREGQFISPNDPIVAFYDTSEYILDIDVPDSLITSLKTGDIFTLETKGQTLEGKITGVQTLLDSETRMGLARASLPSKHAFPLGGRVSINVVVAQKENALSIPRSAVTLKDGKPTLYKIIDGKASLAFVELGLETDDRLEVLKGISIGDQVILKGQGGIWPTKAVQALIPESNAIDSTVLSEKNSKTKAETKNEGA
ncbi:MAG: efflux RND transporter periplasmic adaptor subunit [Alphaproteobacteria bacterium]|nr:efflux RND transporter periplasmic adaptor subunit [Alphaproteobacteria bacterium]NCQ66173.1 efflux RND transporter periplasmic adaptor subunit [Alphaproteobacteria bacterium]NCT06521.1 efflux RND transporter periplasmic adaptor subunit [Alphaproteobacteria bacterium]